MENFPSVSNNGILTLPEIIGLDAKRSLVRIPPELDVPLTSRVRAIIDTWEFRRLAGISQLGLVALVYPGARHTRFEHSLGVYRLSLLVLKRLVHDSRFALLVTDLDALTFIAAALLHDIGHYPYCHLLEDLKLPGLVPHEVLAKTFIQDGAIGDILRSQWKVEPLDVLALLAKRDPERGNDDEMEYNRRKKVFRLFASILSGPVDIDKMDYLYRDSLGAGVPYGKNFDMERLIGSLCLNREGDGLAISDKGKTAAELMVFARYVMFSEVYWHHTVRAATVMFQRAFNMVVLPKDTIVFEEALHFSDKEMFEFLRQRLLIALEKTEDKQVRIQYMGALHLLEGIFGGERLLYKRVRQFSIIEEPDLYRILAGRPFQDLWNISRQFIVLVNKAFKAKAEVTGKRAYQAKEYELLLDAPPVDREVEFQIDIYYPRENRYRSLSEASPVIRALAREQFDDYVKRVRLFATPSLAKHLLELVDINEILQEAIGVGKTD